LDVEHEETVPLTTFLVKDDSRLFLTNLQSRCRAAELWCYGEVSSSARGDDDYASFGEIAPTGAVSPGSFPAFLV